MEDGERERDERRMFTGHSFLNSLFGNCPLLKFGTQGRGLKLLNLANDRQLIHILSMFSTSGKGKTNSKRLFRDQFT